ncbi:hypothetical protein FGU65_02425 [Methanoculleus sp. FWC-SCC1]|uniref:Uncharacterized protein n=1 Tax=Methanoculleus frigidifontis TaxID=2584085 RepID=A0ABT8M764_9EURY|nr:hypothetical protein [Methanoculleus sp. FWC-SCC1]MDN7023761.1 hypothetical protein [Methanoculleus sp. FWC-SCC1]
MTPCRRILLTLTLCLLLCALVGGAAALTIESSTADVVHGSTFTVTVTGEPETVYSLSVNGTDLTDENRYTRVAPGQPGVSPSIGVPVGGAADDPRTTANGTLPACSTRHLPAVR